MDAIDESALRDLLVYALIAGVFFGLIAGLIRQGKGGASAEDSSSASSWGSSGS